VGEMHVISSFEHSTYLELAMVQLEEQGIEKANIVAVPLERSNEQRRLFDTIHRSDGSSLLDLAAVFATIFSVLGASVGFELTWGPIIWGLIGVGFGAIMGFTLDVCLSKKVKRQNSKLKTEVILIIRCKETDFITVKKILFKNMAFGVGELN
jgi:hypothetical protein